MTIILFYLHFTIKMQTLLTKIVAKAKYCQNNIIFV